MMDIRQGSLGLGKGSEAGERLDKKTWKADWGPETTPSRAPFPVVTAPLRAGPLYARHSEAQSGSPFIRLHKNLLR